MRIELNGKYIECADGKTIRDIAAENGVRIPTLCYQEDFAPEARCRVCVVEADGNIVTACNTFPRDGMSITTDTERVKKIRRMNLELMMSAHLKSCFVDVRKHELCRIVSEEGMNNIRFSPTAQKDVDNKGIAVVRDMNKCIICGRCVQACRETQIITAIDFAHRGYHSTVTPYMGKTLHDSYCIKCGQCILSCPVEAITEQDHTQWVAENIANPKKHVIAQIAPSIRVALGEEFGLEPGENVKGKMVAACRKLGFDRTFDTNLTADLTIIEESHELLERVANGGVLPMFTSCCPGWVKYVEHFRHDLIPHLSSCKSPHQMMGALLKSYYAEKNGIDPEDIVVVSIMPCTAKKFESSRSMMESDVDYVLSTRELARMIKMQNIDFLSLPDEDFDNPLGISTGAAALFGATGGVMEAALRTAYEKATGKYLTKLEFDQIRGFGAQKSGSIMINGLEVKFAVAHSIGNAVKLLEHHKDYHFIEIMACPGGCIGGGGQPIPTNWEIRKKRMQGIYAEDSNLPLRRSHENPVLHKMYEEFLGEIGGHKSHELLHTSYVKRDL